jgi:hypothetical protein
MRKGKYCIHDEIGVAVNTTGAMPRNGKIRRVIAREREREREW